MRKMTDGQKRILIMVQIPYSVMSFLLLFICRRGSETLKPTISTKGAIVRMCFFWGGLGRP